MQQSPCFKSLGQNRFFVHQSLKKVELKNLCFSDLKEQHQQILQAVKRLRQKTHIIKACFQQAGLKL